MAVLILWRPTHHRCISAMRDPEHLRRLAEAVEGRAAALVRSISEDLMRPTSARQAVGDLMAGLAETRYELGRLMMQMRQVVGPHSPHERRPHRGGLTTAQYLRDLKVRLRLCDQAMAGAAVCVAGHDWPLLPDPPSVLDLAAPQARVIADVLTRATNALTPQPQTAAAVDLGCFPDIPLSAARFVRYVHLAHRLLLARKQAGPVRFIDIGCGGGLKVMLAAEVFDLAEGLDYDAGYVASAVRAFAATGATRCRVFQADGLTFAEYGNYQVLYLYEPMYEPELLMLERIVADAAQPGSIVISPSHRFELRAEALGLTRIAGAVYVRGISADEAEALVAETRRMGPHIADPDLRLPPEAGWVAPLWRASLANGIDPDRLQVG
jgi:hypothetical protein